MNRRTSIIVSITGIVIIILTLLGLTYGYYVSKITGNESTKSIEVITGDSSVKFTDLSEDNINEIIEPGFTTTKTFTVENTGNIGATYSIYFVDVYNDFVRTEDIVYTLYRIDNDSTFPTDYEGCIENPTDEKSCKIVVNNAEFPTSVALIKANEVITAPEDVFRYDLVITYINQPDINQNVDQGHTFRGSINLRASMDDFDNPFSEATLAYNILKNSMNKLNGTEYIEPTLQDGTNYTKPAEQISNANEKILTYTTDDYGTSYYYRGNVTDNYVNFAEMCWRIVRIQGDGSVKLILEDQYSECNDNEVYTGAWNIATVTNGTIKTGNFGYDDTKITKKYLMNYLNPSTNSITDSMSTAFKNFQTDKLSSYIEILKSGGWCFGDIAYSINNTSLPLTNLEKETIHNSGTLIGGYYENSQSMNYDSYIRIVNNSKKTSMLKCNGTILDKFSDDSEMYVGTLTADEVVNAGAKFDYSSTYYLSNKYQRENSLYWWTLTPSDFDGTYERVFHIFPDGLLLHSEVFSNSISFRPSINLASGALVTEGEGTLLEPYVIQ